MKIIDNDIENFEKSVCASSWHREAVSVQSLSSLPFAAELGLSSLGAQDSILCKWWHSKQGKILDTIIFGLLPQSNGDFIWCELQWMLVLWTSELLGSSIKCNGLKLPHLNLTLTRLCLQIIRMALNFIAKAPGNFLRFSQPRLKTFAKYAKVELTPPSPGELGQVKKENLQN